MSVVYIIIGLILLVFGGEFLVRSSVGLSFKLNISKMVIGMTVVSFATSAPELLVSLQAALDGSPAIAINNVIGSNIANIGMVLGITALIGPIAISKDFYKINWPVMMLFSLALWGMLSYNNDLNAIEGGVLLIGLALFLVYLIKNAKSDQSSEEVDDALAAVSYFKIIIWLLIGGLALYFGSELLVDGAKTLARNQGISEGVISVTMIAIGTSVPELAASVIAAIRGEKAISLGNLLGSNIFNIASVLGLTSMITTIKVTEPQILSKDIFWMLGFAFVLLPMAYFYKKNEIGRIKGFVLLIGYVSFIYLAFK
ncbi:calcium/sodium antiporter [Tenacibaculum sp. HL-MS23]|uniref:calcium/sodium antiporter n=1 Tax=Tenacibaculum TaxID=104267 RepID=UPI001C4FCC48|nr:MULTISPECIES: calcium/sodium antiporter [Tenacibaculum]QXP72558.1 calcium/sodium antiporter [Tenacibaculum sp. AHE14PA]QXP76472.1 calcium/sodium antiporter [Tenacibaculum sp. AHE15PA]WNW02984.1 calcium/sodium antiporter [Tenacibaculum sp. HL-MS23]